MATARLLKLSLGHHKPRRRCYYYLELISFRHIDDRALAPANVQHEEKKKKFQNVSIAPPKIYFSERKGKSLHLKRDQVRTLI